VRPLLPIPASEKADWMDDAAERAASLSP